MDQKYLGDSYDFLKRFLHETLNRIAPFYAHEQFVPESIREKYTKLTGISMLDERSDGEFGVLLDPDTGIAVGHVTRRHVPPHFIVDLYRDDLPLYVICYDQSFQRQMGKRKQMGEKMKYLADHEIPSFYCDSHTPFLISARDKQILNTIFKRLTDAGVPDGPDGRLRLLSPF